MRIPANLLEAIPQALLDIFQQGRPADRVVDYYLKNHKKWGSRDRRFFAENIYNLVRHYRKFWVLAGLNPDDYLNPDKITLKQMQTLLNFQQENKDTELKTLNKFAEQESFTDYFHELGASELGKDWEPIARALNHQAPVYLRTNELKTSRENLQKKLAEEGVVTRVREENTTALELVERKNVFITQSYLQGMFEVQDLSSQFVAPLLAPKPGEKVVDACAGAGGKTLHLAAMMKNKGRIHAFDITQRKLDELRKRSSRAGVDLIETKLLDSAKVIKRLENSVDALLLDVPCSGSGVLKRNPDTKWKFQKADWDRLLQTQAEIIHNYSKMVKTGGRLVYATCSVFPSENMNQVTEFLKQNPNYVLSQSKFCRPDQDAGDGFFMALLQKN